MHEDLAQERAIAEWLGEDPKKAVRAFVRQEHKFYDIIVPFYGDDDQGSGQKRAIAPMVILRAVRTPEGKAARAERNRQWWRTNGRAYRQARKERDGRILPGGTQYNSMK
jgi:hypothetical protein